MEKKIRKPVSYEIEWWYGGKQGWGKFFGPIATLKDGRERMGHLHRHREHVRLVRVTEVTTTKRIVVIRQYTHHEH